MVSSQTTKDKPVAEFHVYDEDGKLKSDNDIDTDQPTFVITHGFIANGKISPEENKDWVKDKAQAYRDEHPNANIIVVDWEEAAALDMNAAKNLINEGLLEHDLIDIYKKAANNTPEIGKQLGDYLADQKVNPKTTELVGHSLGAHVSGAAGAQFHERTGQKINTITALDPAAPGFEKSESLFEKSLLEMNIVKHKLDSGDAENVVAIHSSIILGYESDVGILDIHLNSQQPNGINPVTAHGYAYEFHTSLIKKDFYIQPNGTILNLESLKTLKGSFNVDTRNAHIIHKKNPELLEKLSIDKKNRNKVGEFHKSRKPNSNKKEFERMSESLPYDEILKYFKSN